MEDDLNWRQPQWKTTSKEDDLNERRSQYILMSYMTRFKCQMWLYWQFLQGRQSSWKQLASLAQLAKLELSLAQLSPSLLYLFSCNSEWWIIHPCAKPVHLYQQSCSCTGCCCWQSLVQIACWWGCSLIGQSSHFKKGSHPNYKAGELWTWPKVFFIWAFPRFQAGLELKMVI